MESADSTDLQWFDANPWIADSTDLQRFDANPWTADCTDLQWFDANPWTADSTDLQWFDANPWTGGEALEGPGDRPITFHRACVLTKTVLRTHARWVVIGLSPGPQSTKTERHMALKLLRNKVDMPIGCFVPFQPLMLGSDPSQPGGPEGDIPRICSGLMQIRGFSRFHGFAVV